MFSLVCLANSFFLLELSILYMYTQGGRVTGKQCWLFLSSLKCQSVTLLTIRLFLRISCQLIFVITLRQLKALLLYKIYRVKLWKALSIRRLLQRTLSVYHLYNPFKVRLCPKNSFFSTVRKKRKRFLLYFFNVHRHHKRMSTDSCGR